jgi:hypothetical protein
MLETSPPERFINDAVDCHLRVTPGGGAKNRRLCKLCQVHEDIEHYEGMIFHFVKSDLKEIKGAGRSAITAKDTAELEDKGVFLMKEQRKGTWADSEAERLLRALLKYARQRFDDDDVLEDGAAHLKCLEAMKKEFKLMRILWRQVYDHVAGVDELNMSTMRLRLRYEDEPITSQVRSLLGRQSNLGIAFINILRCVTYLIIYFVDWHQSLREGVCQYHCICAIFLIVRLLRVP